jgi:hypothetical protein
VTAVLLALAAAASFGAMTVAIRVGLASGGSASRASAATLVTSFVVTFAASLVRHDYMAAWKFFLAGLLAPGLSQILFTRELARREPGAVDEHGDDDIPCQRNCLRCRQCCSANTECLECSRNEAVRQPRHVPPLGCLALTPLSPERGRALRSTAFRAEHDVL